MDYKELISKLTPDIYERLKTAVEIGKWPDGRPLTQEQKTSCMEAVLSYQALKLEESDHAGYMPDKCASKSSPKPLSTSEQVIKIH